MWDLVPWFEIWGLSSRIFKCAGMESSDLKVVELVPSDFGNIGLSPVRHLCVFENSALWRLKIVKWKVHDLIPIDFIDSYDLENRFLKSFWIYWNLIIITTQNEKVGVQDLIPIHFKLEKYDLVSIHFLESWDLNFKVN